MRIVFLILFFLCSNVFASPSPATSTSIITDLSKGYFLSYQGIDIRLDQSAWNIKPGSKPLNYSFSLKQEDPKFTGEFSLKLFDQTKKNTIEANTKKWLKEYAQFGFEVLGTKTFTQNSEKGVVIDLFQAASIKQTRQIIFQNEKWMAIFTCQDSEKSFKSTLNLCNDLVKNFGWKR